MSKKSAIKEYYYSLQSSHLSDAKCKFRIVAVAANCWPKRCVKRRISKIVPSWDKSYRPLRIKSTPRCIVHVISILIVSHLDWGSSWTKSYSCELCLAANYILWCQSNSYYTNLIYCNEFLTFRVIPIYRGANHGSRQTYSAIKDKFNAQVEKKH